MRKNAVWLLGALLAAGLSIAPWGAQAANKRLVIGCSLPLSGPLVGFGQPIKRGMDLAVETFNHAQEIPGATVVLACNDSRGDPREAVNVAARLVDQPSVLASISDFTSGATMAAAATYGDGGLIQLTPSASNPAITGMNKWMFRTSETIPGYIDPIADFIVHDLGKKRVAMVQVETDWGEATGKAFAARLKQDGGTLVDNEIYNQGTTDFRAILTKLRRERPDAIFLTMLEEEAATFMRQFRQLDMGKIPVIDSGVGITYRSIALAQGAMNGVYSLELFDPNSEDAGVQTFVKTFNAKYAGQHLTPDIWAAYGWDAATVIMDAMKRAWPNETRANVRDQLANTGVYDGANGKFSMNPKTREIKRFSLTEIRVENNRIVYGKSIKTAD